MILLYIEMKKAALRKEQPYHRLLIFVVIPEEH